MGTEKIRLTEDEILYFANLTDKNYHMRAILELSQILVRKTWGGYHNNVLSHISWIHNIIGRMDSNLLAFRDEIWSEVKSFFDKDDIFRAF